MSETPVDVVIPCFNGARTLGQTLDRALMQTHRAVRVLVVDDGSTDGSRRVVESYGGRVGYAFKENGGQASARNLGIAQTEAPFVCLLDADDLPAPRMVEKLLARLESEPGADLAHADVLGFWGDDFRHPHAEYWRPAADWISYLEPLSILCAVHGSATLIRRSVFGAHGAFPESRTLQGCEDWRFWLQAALGGAVFRRVPEVLCFYRYHAGASSFFGRAVAQRESNLMRSAVDLFHRHGAVSEERRAVLAAGILSVAARWLTLGERAPFEKGRALAREVAPRVLEKRQAAVEPSGRGAVPAGSVNLHMADLLVDLGQPLLASVLFLRCRNLPALRAILIRSGAAGVLERVSSAVSGVVRSEIDRSIRAPSFATHLATALGTLALASGAERAARERFDEASILDPGNIQPVLNLIGMDLRRGRLRAALALWREIGERRETDVPADRLRRVARSLAVRSVQRHPGLREAASGLAARAARLRPGPRP